MKVKIDGKWHKLQPGEFIVFDYITMTIRIERVSFTGTSHEA